MSGWEVEGGYRLVLFGEQDAITAEQIVQLWTREKVVPLEEAQRRVGELLLIAVSPDGEPVGVTTAALGRYEPMRAQFWFFRAFVANAHRHSTLALTLANAGREVLTERWNQGDRRGLGVVYVVQNEGLKRPGQGKLSSWNARAHWKWVDFWFVGETTNGHHVRVHFFPGAHAPEP